ncbi:uncharacterized protein LOC142529128 isoform X4 [Primulina tabacum]|uniref:uncharacterized protein LOC142529128 isoform X4 n=1 Tax=Primulina tabacum TaxID=48773 RepID=UPI003F5A925B
MEFLYSCVEVDSIERGPNFAGFITMRDISEGMLRMMCDKYQTIRDSKYATWVTRLHGCNRELVKDLAELALDSYNQTEQKNFKLEKVCKLNRKNVFFCMTFRARNAEIDECRLFRGVVVFDDVLLCEIMDGDTIKGDGNHVAASFRSKEAHYPRTRYNASPKSKLARRRI